MDRIIKDISSPKSLFFKKMKSLLLTEDNVKVSMLKFDSQYYADSLFNSYGISDQNLIGRASIKRKADFFAGRFCASQILHKIGLVKHQVNIGSNREPIWPKGFIGSITHTENIALCALTKQKHHKVIGIDVENLISLETIQLIKRQILNDKELLILNEFSVDLLQLCFTVMFSVKESFFKAFYPIYGDYFGFETIEIIRVDLNIQTIFFRAKNHLEGAVSLDEIFEAQYFRLSKNALLTFFCM